MYTSLDYSSTTDNVSGRTTVVYITPKLTHFHMSDFLLITVIANALVIVGVEN
jgi:hypothetical protein